MEAEFFTGPTPPDKKAQLKKAVADAAAKASADRAKIVVDFGAEKLEPLPPGEEGDLPEPGVAEMPAPFGAAGAIAAMRRLGQQERAMDAVDAWKAGQAGPPKKIILPGQEHPEDQQIEVANEILDPDDPTFLLEQQLGLIPGISKTRASKMAKGSRAGMHNLTVTARRKYELEERAKRQAARKGKKGRRGR